MIRRLAVEGPIELACWCAPESCHADVIREAVEHTIARMEANGLAPSF